MAEVLQAAESPVPGPQRRMEYEAFLSYAHRDRDVTSAIQKGLHQIGRRVGQLRALRVFRDDTNLTANPDLWAKITEALDGSRFMIVVLSPQSAASHWVNEEVKHWLSQRGHQGLMLVLAEGDLQWNAEDARFDPERSSAALPTLTEPGSLPAEPLYIDVSGDAPWELRSLAFRDKVTSLAAPIHGKPKDDLTGDDLREQRRFRRLRRAAIAALAVLTVIAVAAAVIAVVQRGEAIRQRQDAIREARDALAAQLDTKASTAFSRFTAAESDIHALADTLAAQRIRSDPAASRDAFYTAATALNTTRIIIPTPTTVKTVAFSPDGHTLASGSLDATIRLWNLTDPAHPTPLGQPLTGHTGTVRSLAFSPDGHTLAAGSEDDSVIGAASGIGDDIVRLWNLSDPAHAAALGQPLTGNTSGVTSLSFSPDGHTLAAGSDDATIRLWNLTDPAHPGPLGQPLTGHTDAVDGMAFSPDGHTLASGSNDATIRLWNLTNPAHPAPLGQPLTGHTNAVTSVAFSPDGHTLASGSADSTIRLWNLDTAVPLTGHTNAVTSVAFSPDGHTLASGSADHSIRLWNLTDPAHPTPLGQPLTGHTDNVVSVAFSPDGHTLASGSYDDTIRLWNLTDPAHPARLGQPLTQLWAGLYRNTGQTNTVASVAFSPDGHTLASSSDDATIRLWNLTDPAHPAPLGEPLTGHTNAVTSVAFSPDGHTLASGSQDDTIQLWNLTDPAHPAPLGGPLTGHTSYVDSVAFSPDRHTLASGSWDTTVRLWPTPLDATVATLCSKLTSNISHRDWHDWISPTIGYITLCPNLPVPQQ
jgi:WD40 repeat protein